MKHWLKRNRSFFVFLFCIGFFRLAIADWNVVPSGSMRPTILEGEMVMVDRLAYDLKVPLTDRALVPLRSPQRGDVVVFLSPRDRTRLIKRLVAVPGDTVELRDEVLYINGVPSVYSAITQDWERSEAGGTLRAIRAREHLDARVHAVQFLPDVPALRSFGPAVVPDDSYFFLGDNRDNSADSRYFGFVPRRLLVGRAHHILVSADTTGNWLPRFDRFGQRID